MDIKDYAQAVALTKDLLLSIAVVIGGGWTLYTFCRLRLVRRAIAELKQLEKATIEQAAVTVGVAVRVDASPDRQYVVRGHVTLKNTGNRDVYVSLSDPDSCELSKVQFNDDGFPWEEPILALDVGCDGYFLRAGVEVSLAFIARVDCGGAYVATVKARLASEELKRAGAAGEASADDEFWWLGRAYFLLAGDLPTVEMS